MGPEMSTDPKVAELWESDADYRKLLSFFYILCNTMMIVMMTERVRCSFLDDTGYCTPAEELQADWPKQVENLRLDDDQEFPAVTRLYT